MRVEVNQEQIAGINRMLSGIAGGSNRTISRALNKTLTNVQTRSVKLLGQDLNLKAARIKKDFSVIKANPGNISAVLKCKSRPPGLINFGAKETKKGVTYKIKKAGSRQLWKHAFFATFKIGKGKDIDSAQVVVRKYKGARKQFNPKKKYGALPGKYRFDIEAKYGPKIASVYSKPEIMTQVESFAGERIAFNLDAEAERELRKFA